LKTRRRAPGNGQPKGRILFREQFAKKQPEGRALSLPGKKALHLWGQMRKTKKRKIDCQGGGEEKQKKKGRILPTKENTPRVSTGRKKE